MTVLHTDTDDFDAAELTDAEQLSCGADDAAEGALEDEGRTPDAAATAIPAGPRRFQYLDQTFDDPDPTASIEAVRQALVPFFPELAQATHQATVQPDGTVLIRFEKQVTTKGLSSAGIVAALATLTPTEDPLAALAEQGVLTRQMSLLELEALAPELEDVYAAALAQRDAARTLAGHCGGLHPVALACVPLGF